MRSHLIDIVAHADVFFAYGLSGFPHGLLSQAVQPGTRRSKRPRTKKCQVQGIRTVRRCQNDNAFLSIESIHLGKQLVQGLLTLVVSGESAAVTFLPTVSISSIKTIHGAFSFSLLEQVRTFAAPCRRTSRRTRSRKWRRTEHLPLRLLPLQAAFYRFLEGPTSSAPFGIFTQFLHIFGLCGNQQSPVKFLCLILSGNICKFNAGFGLYINLGVALSKAHRISHAAHPILLVMRFISHCPERNHHNDRYYPC